MSNPKTTKWYVKDGVLCYRFKLFMEVREDDVLRMLFEVAKRKQRINYTNAAALVSDQLSDALKEILSDEEILTASHLDTTTDQMVRIKSVMRNTGWPERTSI